MEMCSYHKIVIYLSIIVFVLTTSIGCAARTDTQNNASGKVNVTVSILPQKYFVERVGGEHVNVNVMVGPGSNPHIYEPKPEQMRALSDSVAYFSIGVDFENAWLERIASANSNMVMVNTIANIERMPMVIHNHTDEEHEEHEHAGLDPHVWTSPKLVKKQARAIYEALAEIDPAHAANYKANFDDFMSDIDELETEIRENLSELETRKFMVFHPSWGYFARDFGLEQIPIEIGGQEPSAAELARLITEAKEENIKVIFAQPEFSTKDAETIAREIGGEVLLISPLDSNWLQNMRDVADAFAKVLAE